MNSSFRHEHVSQTIFTHGPSELISMSQTRRLADQLDTRIPFTPSSTSFIASTHELSLSNTPTPLLQTGSSSTSSHLNLDDEPQLSVPTTQPTRDAPLNNTGYHRCIFPIRWHEFWLDKVKLNGRYGYRVVNKKVLCSAKLPSQI